MQIALYRSKVHKTYPDEMMSYCYSFQPIEAEERCRNGQLMSWTDDSGLEPFVWIEAPDGARIKHSGQGWQLWVAGAPELIDADEVYDLAQDNAFGLLVVQETEIIEQRQNRVG